MATATATPKVEPKAPSVTLGQLVQYQSQQEPSPLVALVIATHDDGTSDLRVFNGYCQGTTDYKNVVFSDDAEAGKVSKLGAKPKVPAPAPPPTHQAQPHEHDKGEHKHGHGETQ